METLSLEQYIRNRIEDDKKAMEQISGHRDASICIQKEIALLYNVLNGWYEDNLGIK